MSGFSLAVVYTSIVGALAATFLGTRAAIKFTTWARSPWLRLSLILSSTFSAIYAISYWWLLNHPTEGGEWSETLRPVGALSWLIGPWVAFPLALEQQLKHRSKEMQEMTATLLEEVRKDDPTDNLS